MALFVPYETAQSYKQAVAQWAKQPAAPIPLCLGPRTDLQHSIELASTLYDEFSQPPVADLAIWFSDDPGALDAFQPMLSLLARQLGTIETVQTYLQTTEQSIHVLLVGTYSYLRSDKLQPLLFQAYEDPRLKITVLTGRDNYSLSWLMAKQFVQANHTKQGTHGIFTYQSYKYESQANTKQIKLYGEADFEEQNIQDLILNQVWRSVLFHGHGKDDNLNLGAYTVCGRNASIAAQVGTLHPRCGYNTQGCFKDEAKLIPLNEVMAENVIISSCNSAPLVDLMCYDPKYLLLLNAIDGPAKVITAALTVQDSSELELYRWIEALQSAEGGAAPAALFNLSLNQTQSFPAFWQFGGVPSATLHSEQFLDPQPLPLLTTMLDRAQKYLVNHFLPSTHSLRKRLETFNQKVNNDYLKRGSQSIYTQPQQQQRTKQLLSLVDSLDYALASLIIENPEDDLMNFESYASDRSRVDQSTIEPVRCSCGHEAIRFNRVGLAASIPTIEQLLCFRCGDQSIVMEDGPRLTITAPTRLEVGARVEVSCDIHVREPGRVTVGWFVPVYIREHLKTKPQLHKLKAQADSHHTVRFSIEFDEMIPAQGYYFTVFAVQNLNLSLGRQALGIEAVTPKQF
ncbi:MAG: hypothetical protein H0T73_11940 [Ardenticatenales bacterium]|nr:hypothetical protein [Ardenticatenales bacterium]